MSKYDKGRLPPVDETPRYVRLYSVVCYFSVLCCWDALLAVPTRWVPSALGVCYVFYSMSFDGRYILGLGFVRCFYYSLSVRFREYCRFVGVGLLSLKSRPCHAGSIHPSFYLRFRVHVPWIFLLILLGFLVVMWDGIPSPLARFPFVCCDTDTTVCTMVMRCVVLCCVLVSFLSWEQFRLWIRGPRPRFAREPGQRTQTINTASSSYVHHVDRLIDLSCDHVVGAYFQTTHGVCGGNRCSGPTGRFMYVWVMLRCRSSIIVSLARD